MEELIEAENVSIRNKVSKGSPLIHPQQLKVKDYRTVRTVSSISSWAKD